MGEVPFEVRSKCCAGCMDHLGGREGGKAQGLAKSSVSNFHRGWCVVSRWVITGKLPLHQRTFSSCSLWLGCCLDNRLPNTNRCCWFGFYPRFRHHMLDHFEVPFPVQPLVASETSFPFASNMFPFATMTMIEQDSHPGFGAECKSWNVE